MLLASLMEPIDPAATNAGVSIFFIIDLNSSWFESKPCETVTTGHPGSRETQVAKEVLRVAEDVYRAPKIFITVGSFGKKPPLLNTDCYVLRGMPLLRQTWEQSEL